MIVGNAYIVIYIFYSVCFPTEGQSKDAENTKGWLRNAGHALRRAGLHSNPLGAEGSKHSTVTSWD